MASSLSSRAVASIESRHWRAWRRVTSKSCLESIGADAHLRGDMPRVKLARLNEISCQRLSARKTIINRHLCEAWRIGALEHIEIGGEDRIDQKVAHSNVNREWHHLQSKEIA